MFNKSVARPVSGFSALLREPGKITDLDVRNFRMEVFGDGIVSREEAEAVFAINNTVEDKCEAWLVFFVEAMVDYTVMQAEPKGYVSVSNAEWLIDQISHDGVVESRSELELLVKIIEKASQSPQMLSAFALSQVANAVIDGKGELMLGRTLTRGVIEAPEVELLRRILYGFGGEGGISISQAEAEVLFDLNDQTVEAQNCAAWSDLFVKAFANYLMAVSGYRGLSRQETLRGEEWLEDTETDVTGMLASSLRSVGQLFSRDAIADVFKSDTDRMQEAWKDRNSRFEETQRMAEQVDDREGNWLADRIGRDGVLHANERALLEFIREESPMVHPAIQSLLDKVA